MNLLDELKRRKVLQVAAVSASAVFAIVEAVAGARLPTAGRASARP
jgi:hypothetical protein